MTPSPFRMKRYKFTLPKSVNTPGPLTERGIQGFVIYVTSWSLFGVYLIWAYVPHQYLHSLGFTYLPSRWWAIIVPWTLLIGFLSGVGIYLWMNRHLVHPPSSINLICDRTNSELGLYLRKDNSKEDMELFETQQVKRAFIPNGSVMPPTLDLSVDWVNKQLYLRPQRRSP